MNTKSPMFERPERQLMQSNLISVGCKKTLGTGTKYTKRPWGEADQKLLSNVVQKAKNPFE